MPHTATIDSFRREVARLVDIFGKNLAAYKSGGYDEASLRQEFLNPLFRALGWDIENKAGLILQHREVEIESRTQIGGRQKRADYLFRTHPTDRFVCEAKKPAEELHASYAFQAKRCAWNKGLALAVLTDFEEMKIFIVGGKPYKDEPDVGLWKTFHFRQYPLVAQEIWSLLSRDRVATGSIDQLIDSLPKRPTAKGRPKQGWLIRPDRSRALDTDFLNFLDEARRELASDLLRHNDRADLLEGTRLNEAVQRILDRILFLRICEDRDVDTGRPLDRLVRSWRDDAESEAARRARQQPLELHDEPPAGYGGSGLRAPKGTLWHTLVRHFRSLDRRPPSHIPFFNGNLFKPHFSEELVVSDDWLARFLDELGDDESPYLFNYIAVEILGTIYERFLGKVVRPQGRGVTIEEKPEVRKAGGVYYTPRYIVEYIAGQTVGKLLVGRKPEETLKLRILDPACGSGSFLIRAFEQVCEHCQQWLTDHPDQRRKDWCWLDEKENALHLTTRAKRRILCETIHGVDLDPQAVEVTELSLYLKMLESENRATLAHERDLFGSDEALLPPLQANIKEFNSLIGTDFSLVAEELTHVKARDWVYEFPAIMKAGGFDAVIGNPPYILLQTMEEPAVFAYLSERFRSARYKIDTYQVFMERALNLTKEGGRFGFITPNSFLRNKHAIELRSLFLEASEVAALRTFYYSVFKGASVDTCILIARKAEHPGDDAEIEVVRSQTPDRSTSQSIPQQKWLAHPQRNFFLPGAGASAGLLEKVSSRAFALGEIATAYFGIQTFDREKYVTDRKALKAHKPVIDGVHIQRYDLLPGTEFVDFRPHSIKSGGNPGVYESERIGVRQIGRTPIGTMIPAGIYSLNTIYNIFFTKPTSLNLRFILGLMSSSTGRWLWEQSFFDQKETFPKVKKDALLSIPIPRLDLSVPADRTRHDRLVGLVDKMLALTPKLRVAKTDAERQTLQNAVTTTDQQIDTLVYELYGLTEGERKLVAAEAERRSQGRGALPC